MAPLFPFLAILFLISPASASIAIVRDNPDAWTCVDYSISYTLENPEWGLVSISSHPDFRGVSHMVNYQLNGTALKIHDGYHENMPTEEYYTLYRWQEYEDGTSSNPF